MASGANSTSTLKVSSSHHSQEDRKGFPIKFYPIGEGKPDWGELKEQCSDTARCRFTFDVVVVNEDERDIELCYESGDFEDHSNSAFLHPLPRKQERCCRETARWRVRGQEA